MIQCYNAHRFYQRGEELFLLECDFLSKAFLHECRKYFLDLDKYIAEEREGKDVYDIQEVNVKELMFCIPIHILNSIAEVGVDVPDFLGRKLIQLMNISRSDEVIETDKINQVILQCIMLNAEKGDAFQYDKIEELLDMEVEGFFESGKRTKSKNPEKFIRQRYARVFKNLHTLYRAEVNGEISLLLKTLDYNFDFRKWIISFFQPDSSLLKEYVYEIFTGVGLDPPFQVFETWSRGKGKNIELVIDDCIHDAGKEEGKIVEFYDGKVARS